MNVQAFVLTVVLAVKTKVSVIQKLLEVSLHVITSGDGLLCSPLITENVFFFKGLLFKSAVQMYFSDLPSGFLCKKVNVVYGNRKPLFRMKGGVCFFGSFVL